MADTKLQALVYQIKLALDDTALKKGIARVSVVMKTLQQEEVSLTKKKLSKQDKLEQKAIAKRKARLKDFAKFSKKTRHNG